MVYGRRETVSCAEAERPNVVSADLRNPQEPPERNVMNEATIRGQLGSPSQHLLQLARDLDHLGRRVEQFLEEQLRRLEHEVQSLRFDASAASGANGKSSDREREQWERQRREEIRQLEEDRQALSEAWSRLEAEQRNLLVQRQSAQLTQEGFSSPRAAEPLEESEAESGRYAPASHGSPEFIEPREATNDRRALDEAARQAVIRQFQQLKSDVRKHAGKR